MSTARTSGGLGPTNGACYGDLSNTMNQAKNAAAALGYNLASYTNFVLYSPNNSWQAGSDCNGYAGWAYVGAPGIWLNGYMDRRVTVHEQGHNYGLMHSHSYLCDGVITGTCTWSDYGDIYDAMGSSGLVGHFSASQKDLLGWMNGRTVDLTAGGSATLAPLAGDAVAPGAAVVNASPGRSYWLEYRQAIDYDSGLPTGGPDGVLVHVKDPAVSGDNGSNLLDARPGDGLSVGTATLRAGSSWTTPEGFRLSVGSVTPTGAAVTVSGGADCPDANLEPDNTSAQARLLGVPSTESHAFCAAADQDWVKFNGTADTPYRVETLNLSSGTDTVLDLYRADGTTLVASNDDSGGTLASLIDFTPTASGTYLLKARQYADRGSLSFTYDLRLSSTDVTAPTVTSLTPAAGATGVGVANDVNANFSEAVTGVSGTTFSLRTSTGAVVAASVGYNATLRRSWLNPSANLVANRTYTATLTGGTSAIRDAANNPLATTTWSFTTAADTTAPTVTTRTPASGATGTGRTANVTATLSEAVTGVSGATFKLTNPATGAAVTAVVSRNGTTNQWILNPSAALAARTRYTASLTGGTSAIRDLANNPLATTSWSFTTGA